MNSLLLAGILKRIYNDFDMASFENRLKLQKIIYLIQIKVGNLGYNYRWYLYGPYSDELTRDGYAISEFKDAQPIAFEEEAIETSFKEFLIKIKDYKDNPKWLEIAASIHLLKSFKLSNEDIVRNIQNKHGPESFKKEEIERVLGEIEGWLI